MGKYLNFVLLSILIVDTTSSISQEIKSIDSLMNVCIENESFNGDILISKKYKSVYKRTIGYRNNETREQLKPNLLFNLASVSKPFTSVAVLQLEEKKLLNINDKVIKYISSFPYDNICIKHLLSHTSGIASNIDFLEGVDQQKGFTNDSIIGLLVRYKPALQFEPGDQWSYSNLGYDILALVVEEVSKMKFDEYMERFVFQPAGMKRTFIPRTANIKQWLPKTLSEEDIALPHNFENIASCELQNIYPSLINSKEYCYGSTNVYSTVYDLSKFDQALINHVILSKVSQESAYQPFQLNNGEWARDTLAPIPSYYGLGWNISIDTTWGKIIWHKGRSGGTRTVFLRNINQKQTVVFLDNNDHWATDLKAIACLKIMNRQQYKYPISKSLVQQLGCDIRSLGFDAAYMDFMKRRETELRNYFISKDEMIDLATLLSDENNVKDALSVIKLCNDLKPGNWDVLLTKGDLLLKNNQIEEALADYRTAVALYSNNEDERISLLGAIGWQLIEKNRLSDAEIVLKLNTDIFPNDCNSFDNYAFILDQNGKLDRAISMEEKAIELATKQNHELLPVLLENLSKLKTGK